MGAVRHLAMVVATLLLVSCKTRERVLTIETVRTDTTYITRHVRDSIYVHDSINVSEKQRGDTLYIERIRWRTEWRDRWQHDTLYIARTDSVPVPYPVEVEVPAPLTWWQKMRLRLGDVMLAVVAALAILGGYRLWRVLRR